MSHFLLLLFNLVEFESCFIAYFRGNSLSLRLQPINHLVAAGAGQVAKAPKRGNIGPWGWRYELLNFDSTSVAVEKGVGKGLLKMDIKRVGSRPSAKGPAEWFTGAVRIDPLFQ